MSDDEFMFDGVDGDDEEYDFDFEDDDDGPDEAQADLENMYYLAKGKRGDDMPGALAAFRDVVEREKTDTGSMGEFGFKSLKQITKAQFHAGQYDQALEAYRELLKYTKSAVTRNYAEKSINTILDYVSLSASIDLGIMEQFYAATNVALEEARNERLSVKTDLKLARLWLARREWARLEKTIRGLKEYCLGPVAPTSGLGAIAGDDGAGGTVSADQNKGTVLMEVFATEIQMYSELKDYMKLKEVYNATLQVKNAIPHPRISGIIRECGGKMHMSESNWTAAQQDFYQAFNSYDEAGSPARIGVLKYLVLAVLFMGSHIDPFDSREMRPYKTDAQIATMLQLAEAYRRNDALQAETVIKANPAVFHGDSFITDYIELLLKYLRHQYILDTVGSYTRLDLHYLAKQLNVSTAVAESLVRTLILDGRLQGRIDQVNETLELNGPWCASEMSQARTQALQKWLHTLQAGNRDLVARVTRLYGHEARVREERSNPSLYR